MMLNYVVMHANCKAYLELSINYLQVMHAIIAKNLSYSVMLNQHVTVIILLECQCGHCTHYVATVPCLISNNLKFKVIVQQTPMHMIIVSTSLAVYMSGALLGF